MTTPSTNLASRVVDWLRAGYPAGVPRQDYVALLGLLKRKLTDVEVHQIAAELAGLAGQGEEISSTDVERLINEATLDTPAAGDVARVSSHLAAGGWPLADDPDH
ncbi:DUF3349 domain-containing protein [Modestobacter altitudinis]|uniref:DUF3349 domain-containing protein n=1 Tax=Modestobacter altitudinis TaxID=2213158 RepID=UPI001FE8B0D9|nr:DUF3349 domain-containing protein [Modestobacter altitudinis]